MNDDDDGGNDKGNDNGNDNSNNNGDNNNGDDGAMTTGTRVMTMATTTR